MELLRAAGLASATDDLEGVLTTAYTTGSEWRGEIGLAIERIRRIGVALPAGVEEIFRNLGREGRPR